MARILLDGSRKNKAKMQQQWTERGLANLIRPNCRFSGLDFAKQTANFHFFTPMCLDPLAAVATVRLKKFSASRRTPPTLRVSGFLVTESGCEEGTCQ